MSKKKHIEIGETLEFVEKCQGRRKLMLDGVKWILKLQKYTFEIFKFVCGQTWRQNVNIRLFFDTSGGSKSHGKIFFCYYIYIVLQMLLFVTLVIQV